MTKTAGKGSPGGWRVKQATLDGTIQTLWIRKRPSVAISDGMPSEREYFNNLRVLKLCGKCTNHMAKVYADEKALQYLRAVPMTSWCECRCHDGGKPRNGIAYGPQAVML
jgi:hypothetical protein